MDEDIHPTTLEQPPPQFLLELYFTVLTFLSDYGWFLLGTSLFGLYLWSKLSPIYDKWRADQEEKEYTAMHHKNPDLYQSRQEAIEAARRKLQDTHDCEAQLAAEKKKMQEEKKKEEFLAKHGAGSYRLGNSTSPGTSKLKSDYNPLAGSSGSGGYRAPKRSCPGGGCG